MGRCVLFRITLLVVLVALTKYGGSDVSWNAQADSWDCSSKDWRKKSFLSAAGIGETMSCNVEEPLCPAASTECTIQTPPKPLELQRPHCVEGVGCDVPLYCFDFQSLGSGSVVPSPPRAVKVTPYELEKILENSTITNCCALVMFYAQWCEFSARFARRFNALGRTFDGLPVLAVDLGENEPHKYILAYLPLVAFYYRGRVLMKFNDLSVSYQEFVTQIANMTGFVPRDVDLMDEENEEPVPTVRVDSDRYLLHMAALWLIFVLLACAFQSKLLSGCLEHFGSRIGRRPFLQPER